MTDSPKEAGVVRPDLFITPSVVGLCVPERRAESGRMKGHWALCLVHDDGKREVRELEPSIELPGGRRLWFHPMPPAPGVMDEPRWSEAGRDAWKGGNAPGIADVFNRLCGAIGDYIEQEPGVIQTLALWVMFTYIYPAWDAVPYLYVTGTKGSGKTRVFELLEQLVYRPLSASSMTGPVLFRTLDGRGGTLLLDEAERLKAPDAQELVTSLLAGHKRGGKASRMEGSDGKFVLREYAVFGPKAFAAINGLPDTLHSRCIPILMVRAASGSPKPRLRLREDAERWRELRDDLHALTLGFMGRVATILSEQQGVCELSNRDYDLWQPLMALAATIEENDGPVGLLASVQACALSIIGDAQEEATPDEDELLLSILAEQIQSGSAPTSSELLSLAKEREPETMGRWWKPRTVSNRLRRYGVKATKGTRGRREYRIPLPFLAGIQGRYGMDLGIEALTAGPVGSLSPPCSSASIATIVSGVGQQAPVRASESQAEGHGESSVPRSAPHRHSPALREGQAPVRRLFPDVTASNGEEAA